MPDDPTVPVIPPPPPTPEDPPATTPDIPKTEDPLSLVVTPNPPPSTQDGPGTTPAITIGLKTTLNQSEDTSPQTLGLMPTVGTSSDDSGQQQQQPSSTQIVLNPATTSEETAPTTSTLLTETPLAPTTRTSQDTLLELDLPKIQVVEESPPELAPGVLPGGDDLPPPVFPPPQGSFSFDYTSQELLPGDPLSTQELKVDPTAGL